ncbi:helix-turn-helix transcriptional regulator [Sulfitobacter sp. S190]|uniref:ArsR/SmtB family transcription factor n=1 Tax=Sulfitobacter sp. S190 TaxID=2867022 RepID=UPI0021A2FAA6|nr:metalloregulator ArsR/SmtB family transcription factor [Sulfitobacter sp. S190]UWR21089.1 metalloregulator ArsR/SmtB family transcription factor [Sulfitobacter sp. S190]
MANQNADLLSPLLAALADPTRRAVVRALGQGPQAVSKLAAAHDMALPSFLKHIDRMERAGLIVTRKSGRVRTCQLQPEGLRPLQDWLAREHARWGSGLDRLAAHLDATEKEKRQ